MRSASPRRITSAASPSALLLETQAVVKLAFGPWAFSSPAIAAAAAPGLGEVVLAVHAARRAGFVSRRRAPPAAREDVGADGAAHRAGDHAGHQECGHLGDMQAGKDNGEHPRQYNADADVLNQRWHLAAARQRHRRQQPQETGGRDQSGT